MCLLKLVSRFFRAGFDFNFSLVCPRCACRADVGACSIFSARWAASLKTHIPFTGVGIVLGVYEISSFMRDPRQRGCGVFNQSGGFPGTFDGRHLCGLVVFPNRFASDFLRRIAHAKYERPIAQQSGPHPRILHRNIQTCDTMRRA